VKKQEQIAEHFSRGVRVKYFQLICFRKKSCRRKGSFFLPPAGKKSPGWTTSLTSKAKKNGREDTAICVSFLSHKDVILSQRLLVVSFRAPDGIKKGFSRGEKEVKNSPNFPKKRGFTSITCFPGGQDRNAGNPAEGQFFYRV